MLLTYDGLPLHQLGEIRVSTQTEFEGGENPVRARRTLSVSLDLFEDSFAANHLLALQVKEKLKVQHGLLVWADGATFTTYLSQPAVVASENFPEDPGGWGTYHQRVEIVFVCYEQLLSNGAAAVQLVCGAATIAFAQMTQWSEELQVERFHAMRSDRRSATVRINAAGTELADTLDTVAGRRTALHARKDAWLAALLGAKEATLTMGSFSKTVRVENFKADVNQAVNAIEWSFTAYYTALPDEADYAIADFRVRERNGAEQPAAGTGEQFLTLSGTVTANSEAAALSRLNDLRNAQLEARGYKDGELVSQEIETGSAQGMDGTTFMERSFTLEFRKWRADNHALTLQKTGGGGVVNFGQVTGFSDGYNARRFSDHRSQRSHAAGRAQLRGTLWLGAWDMAVAARRTLLTARVGQMRDACNGADGRLVYGAHFDRTVRIEDFQAEVNQQLNGIEWSMSAVYSLFPNEAGMATAEYSAEQAEDVESGDATLALNGRIVAEGEAAARAKLDALRTAVLADYGYAVKQQLRAQSTASRVFANGDRTSGLAEAVDGTTFLELSFNEAYRKRMSSVLNYVLRVSDAEELRNGFIVTTYSGTVTASGSDATAAYATALAKAESLGANKWPFMARSSVTWTERQTRAENDVEFVTLEFSYEYQRKGGARAYVEINSSTVTSQFGNDSESISGFISAADLATAQTHYNTLVKAGLAARLILEEETADGTQRLQNGGGFESQFTRLEFRLSVFKRRAAGKQSFRYVLDTAKDWLNLLQTTTVSGTCWAATEAEARAAVTAHLGTLQLGTPRASRTGAELMQWKPSESFEREFGKLDFEEVFDSRITGEGGIIECEVSEEVEYSSTRWVEQPLPRDANGGGGISIMQDAGVTPGRRTARGMVKAATAGIAHAWAAKQRVAFLTGDDDDNSFETAPSLSMSYAFVPRVEGVVSGAGENVRIVTLNFSYGELLPNYAYSPP